MASILAADAHSAADSVHTHHLAGDRAAEYGRLAALLDLSQRLATERDLGSMLQIYCDAARTIIGAAYAVLDLRAADRPAAHHFHTSGLASGQTALLGDQ